MIGIISAIGAAFSWTYACFIWKELTKFFSVVEINLVKNVVAFIIFIPILFQFNLFADLENIIVLLISGVIGIAIGDCLYITAIKRIGTRKTLTVEAISPILATIFGSSIIGDNISSQVWCGTLIITISLLIIAKQRPDHVKSNLTSNSNYRKGVAIAFLSVLCAVVGALLSKIVLTDSTLNPFQTTEIRLLGALIVLIPNNSFNTYKIVKKSAGKLKLKLILAAILGTNLGILLQQTVFLTLPIGTGWTLLSTSPVISLFFAKKAGDKINLTTIFMTFLILLGVWMIFT